MSDWQLFCHGTLEDCETDHAKGAMTHAHAMSGAPCPSGGPARLQHTHTHTQP
jgi:hypothetical protein